MRHGIRFGMVLCLLLAVVAGPRSGFAQETVDSFPGRDHTTLREHPEILMQALGQQLEAARKSEEAEKRRREQEEDDRLARELDKPLRPSFDPDRVLLGPAEAPVTVTLYADLFSPDFPKALSAVTALAAAHPDKVRAVVKNVPRLTNASKAAAYFEALALQDRTKAADFLQRLAENGKNIAFGGETALRKTAAALGADMERLAHDLADPGLKSRLAADKAEAGRFGVAAAPVLLVNGVRLAGDPSQQGLEKIMNLALAKASARGGNRGAGASRSEGAPAGGG